MIKRIIRKVLGVIVTTIYTTSLITIPTMAEDNKIINSSFKNWLDGWNVKGDINAASGKDNWGYDDSYSLGYWNDTDYEVWTEQTITGIENGYYRVEAYAASGGNQEAHYLYANDFWGTGARTSIPITSEFTKVVLNFEVTNNSVTIGFYSKGRAGTWSNYDCISLVKTDEEYKFLKGGDLTMVNYIEDLGGSFYDSEGEERDVFHILAESGFNFARLRTYNDTGREHGSVTNPNYLNEVEASCNNSITVSKDGYSSSTKMFDVVQGEVSKIEIVLGGGSVQGKITDENNNPIEGAEVYSVIGEKKFSTISKADGTYILGDLPAGDNYKINVKMQGYESTYANNVNVNFGEDTNGIDFKLIINSGTISGVVKDNAGNTVSGVSIIAVGNDNKEYKALTDENGQYKIEYIEVGDKYNVTATKEGYLEMSVSNIKVNKGSITEGINFELEKSLGSITGIVVDNNNNKISGAKITITLKDEEKFVTTSDENGVFEIKDVLDNKNYVILCEAEGYGTAKLSNVEVKPSLNKEVILRMSERIVLENWDFEIGTLEGWNVEGDINAVQAQDRTWFGDDAPSGKYGLSVWSDKAFNVNIKQKVENLNCGKYELSAWVYSGGDYNSDFMYIRQGEKVTELEIGHTNNVWQKISIPVWVNSEGVEIGFNFDGKGGCWTVIDSIELNYITNINYDELEDVINNIDLIDKKEYTPKSWNELTNNINEAKKLMVSAEVTQEKIDEAIIAINNAVNSLIKKVDKTALLLLVEEYKDIDKNKYTEESLNEYNGALAIANELINNEDATEEEVNSVIALLKEKYNLLEKVINENESINHDDEDVESNSNTTNEDNKDEVIIKVEENDKGDEIKNNQSQKLPITGGVVSSQVIGLLGAIIVSIGIVFLKEKIDKIQNI